MKREIKFRAYDKRLKIWCYDGVGFELFGEVLMIDGFSSHFIENPAKDENGAYLASLDRIYTDIEVMQYTGLKDKNGKEIYVGDVIESVASDGTKIRHVVEYDDSEARFVCFHVRKHPEPHDVGMGITQKWMNEFKKEIIGNIYESPEKLHNKSPRDQSKEN